MAEAFDVVWAQTAVNDLDDILDFVAERDGVDRALELYEMSRQAVTAAWISSPESVAHRWPGNWCRCHRGEKQAGRLRSQRPES